MKSSPTPLRSLAAHYYTDPAVFAAERRSLLARTWQFAGHVSALPDPGDYFTYEIAGESLFCIRQSDGGIKSYFNVCQHRAHELLQGEGNVRQIVCPYHAWTYALSGELRGGPNLRSVAGFDQRSVCLAEVRIENFHGFLFANLDPDAEPMEAWFPGVRAELGEFVPDIDALAPVEWVEVSEHCNWKVSVENYSECYHCQLNHPTFSNGVVKPQTYDIQAQGYCLRHTTECQNLERMSYSIDLSANPYAGRYSSWFLWPMFSFQVYPGNRLNTYHWRPVDHEHVTLWRGWYGADGEETSTIHALAEQDRTIRRLVRTHGYPEDSLDREHQAIFLIKAMSTWPGAFATKYVQIRTILSTLQQPQLRIGTAVAVLVLYGMSLVGPYLILIEDVGGVRTKLATKGIELDSIALFED